MPPRKRGRGKKVGGAAAPPDAGGGADRISALPDEALHHLLSFLPAEDAVRTCVLARRWRHLWKSATGLRIGHVDCVGHADGDTTPYVDCIRRFFNTLLLLRKRDSCIHTFELRVSLADDYGCFREDTNLNIWIRHVIEREVRVLRIEIVDSSYYAFGLKNPVSQHLKRIALIGTFCACNFSNCPNLEHLEIADGYIGTKISSRSLKHLIINNCYVDCKDMELHTLMCTPNLVSLVLDGHFTAVPVLGSMPSLKKAFARDGADLCCEDLNCFICAEELSDVPLDVSDHKNKCLLLQGLSEAQSLTLICDNHWGVFRSDLECCPTFNNLRNLLLNQWWCFGPDLYRLNLILKHSPVLEKLNLHLFSRTPPHKVEMIGRYNQMERPATILKHLKEIEVKCSVVNEEVHKVLKFLGTFGIHFLFK